MIIHIYRGAGENYLNRALIGHRVPTVARALMIQGAVWPAGGTTGRRLYGWIPGNVECNCEGSDEARGSGGWQNGCERN